MPQISAPLPSPQLLSKYCLPVCSRPGPPTGWRPAPAHQEPLLFLQGLVCGGMQLLQLPQPRVPRSLQNTSLACSVSPNSVISCLVPWNPRRLGEHWNVRCLRSEPESDSSWVEMRGKWPRTTHSFTSFPDLAAGRAGLPNQAGFGQDICSSAGHKAHLDPLRELRAIKFP